MESHPRYEALEHSPHPEQSVGRSCLRTVMSELQVGCEKLGTQQGLRLETGGEGDSVVYGKTMGRGGSVVLILL
jgi:hypothetical protein